MNNNKEKIKESKILIVDDNSVNVKLLERVLRISGFKDIKTLTDSRQALTEIEEYQPELTILDLQMPYYDGFTILEFLRYEVGLEYMPVIVITAQDDTESRLRALSLGAQDYITKPFNNSEVVLRVNNFLEIRTNNREVNSRNSLLEAEVQKKEFELSEMQNELIERLLKATEFRDQETGGHISRIKKYTYVLSRNLGFSEKIAQNVSHASLMHDIGKIGVPDSVLNKKDKLSDSEWDSMKNHTLKGAQILGGSSSEIIRLAEEIALSHHEKWDGSGYPKGLSETKIPLPGRIVALVDVFDALISGRPYKKAWDINEAVEYIVSQKGKHFDPLIVDIFTENLEEFIEIAESH